MKTSLLVNTFAATVTDAQTVLVILISIRFCVYIIDMHGRSRLLLSVLRDE